MTPIITSYVFMRVRTWVKGVSPRVQQQHGGYALKLVWNCAGRRRNPVAWPFPWYVEIKE